jgi:alpha-beta hydrolase superfamily lysophospholipase
MTKESDPDLNDDVTFYMQGWEPQGTPKAVVCLVHGLGEHSGRYAHVGGAFNAAGYALYGFDLRGHGQSGGPRGHIPSLDLVLQDIRQFVGFQRQANPGRPLFLYGHSLGGLFALTYAIQFPEGLRGVIATGPALRTALQEQKMKIAFARLLGSVTPAVTIPSGLDVNAISRDRAVVQAYMDDPLTHEKTSLGLGKAALDAIDFCLASAGDLRPPLLLMHGAADRITYASGSEEFARLAGKTNRDVTLKLWDGLYHELHNEPEQEAVLKTMIEWMDGRWQVD